MLGFLGGQTDLLPVIVIGAVTGFIISKALTPLLPKLGMDSQNTNLIKTQAAWTGRLILF